MEKKTALYDTHVKYGGRMVPYAGWSLPVQYPSGVMAEHVAVRTAAGIFDVSHMGEFLLYGPDALLNLQKLLVNDFENMLDGQVRYSPMCNENGGVVDDLLVYRHAGDRYMLVVNAANCLKDREWIQSKISGDVKFEDISDETAEIALQGPLAFEIVSAVSEAVSLPVKNYSFRDKITVGGAECLVSRTGYTGEDGFEIYCENADAPALWENIMAAGADKGLVPCGLGSRDTLRLEAGMPLYGHEMTDQITPSETGLSFFVKLDKADFIGKDALVKKGRPSAARYGIKLLDKGMARGGERVFTDSKDVGFITSGTLSPCTRESIAMAILDADIPKEDAGLTVCVRGKKLSAITVKLPFYRRNKS